MGRATTKQQRHWQDRILRCSQGGGCRGGRETDRCKRIEIEIAYSTTRRPAERLDSDNVNKPTLDALKGVAYTDDRQVRSATSTVFDRNVSNIVHGGVEDIIMGRLFYSAAPDVVLIMIYSDTRLAELGGEELVQRRRYEEWQRDFEETLARSKENHAQRSAVLGVTQGRRMLVRNSSLATALCVLLLGGCATTARLYNLDTGEVLNATYQNYGTGHGQIIVTTAAGKTLAGEYTTISGASYSSGVGTASVSGSGGYAWATAQGFSFSQPGQQYGSATVAGEGLVIDIVYVVDPWTGHGHGVGKDNRGGRYKVQF